MKTTSFDDAPKIMYQGSRDREIAQGPKTVGYSQQKRPKNMKTTSFDNAPENVERQPWDLENAQRPKKQWVIANRNGKKT